MTQSPQPQIYDYLDYRAYLRDFYAFKKANTRTFSYRAFAKRAGFSSPNFLKVVIEGERNLSDAMAAKFAKGCGLKDAEATYFQDLVRFNQAGTAENRERALEKLLAKRKHRGVVELTAAQHAYFSKWFIPAVRELVARRDFVESAAWIAEHLRPTISPRDAEYALDTLKRLGLVKRNEAGQLVQSAQLVSTADETRSALIGAYHRAVMARAAASIDLFPSDERELSALVMTLGPTGLARLKKRLQALRHELLELTSLEEAPAQVVQLNMQLFPLSDCVYEDGPSETGPPETGPSETGPSKAGGSDHEVNR